MSIPIDAIPNEMVDGWRMFVNNLAKSLDMLEKDIEEAAQMQEECTLEWCEATEHVIDELSNSLFSISEPRWTSDEDSKKLKALKRRVHDLYARYKSTATK